MFLSILLAACGPSETAPREMALIASQEEVVFSTTAGACQERSLSLNNTGDFEVDVTLLEISASCAEQPFSAGAGGFMLPVGAMSTVSVVYCPELATSCVGSLLLDVSGGGEVDVLQVDLRGASSSPDADQDGYRVSDGDCNDSDDTIHPSADELEDERDNDCDGVVDEGTDAYDDDGDGQTELEGDCDDANPDRFLGAGELEDGIDNNCDDIIDERTDRYDDDGDGFSEDGGDCNDFDRAIYPDAAEAPNSADDDCDGIIDEGTVNYDDDSDGMTEVAGDCDDADPTVYPGATEVADGDDDDCDGIIDDNTEVYDDDGDGYSEAQGDCNDANDAICPDSTACPETYNNIDDDCNEEIDDVTSFPPN